MIPPFSSLVSFSMSVNTSIRRGDVPSDWRIVKRHSIVQDVTSASGILFFSPSLCRSSRPPVMKPWTDLSRVLAEWWCSPPPLLRRRMRRLLLIFCSIQCVHIIEETQVANGNKLPGPAAANLWHWIRTFKCCWLRLQHISMEEQFEELCIAHR